MNERDARAERSRDARLVARMSEGDPEALASLYQRHFRSLYALGQVMSRATPNSNVERYRLRTRLSKMPEAQRQVLILGYFEGLTTGEIAERLAIPAGTVKSRTRAALAALREEFAVAG